jgi:hypothetical protein
MVYVEFPCCLVDGRLDPVQRGGCKRQSRLYGVVSQNIELFITTAVRASNPTDFEQFVVFGELFNS